MQTTMTTARLLEAARVALVAQGYAKSTTFDAVPFRDTSRDSLNTGSGISVSECALGDANMLCIVGGGVVWGFITPALEWEDSYAVGCGLANDRSVRFVARGQPAPCGEAVTVTMEAYPTPWFVKWRYAYSGNYTGIDVFHMLERPYRDSPCRQFATRDLAEAFAAERWQHEQRRLAARATYCGLINPNVVMSESEVKAFFAYPKWRELVAYPYDERYFERLAEKWGVTPL